MTTPRESRGWVLPELVVEDVLRDGLTLIDDAVTAGGAAIDNLLKRIYFNESQENRARLKAVFVKDKAEDYVRIIENFPRTDISLPCWAIILASEEHQDFIGDLSHEVQFDDDESYGTLHAEGWTSRIAIATYSENAQQTKWLYHLSKFVVAAGRSNVVQQVVSLAPPHSSGRDLGFDARFNQSGRWVYRRDLYVELKYIQYDASREPVLGLVSETDTVPDVVGALAGILYP